MTTSRPLRLVLLISSAVLAIVAVDGTAAINSDDGKKKNLLFLVCDQLRYDAIGFAQQLLADYDGKVKVRTPNIDRLARRGAFFETAYTVSPTCGPSRTSMLTGNTVQRTGVVTNKLIMSRHYEKVGHIRQKILALESFEQVLHRRFGYQIESYGKFHVPSRLGYAADDNSDGGDSGSTAEPIYANNDYDFEAQKPVFSSNFNFRTIYQVCSQGDAMRAELEGEGIVGENALNFVLTERSYYYIFVFYRGTSIICSNATASTRTHSSTDSSSTTTAGVRTGRFSSISGTGCRQTLTWTRTGISGQELAARTTTTNRAVTATCRVGTR